jgi:hypothetical protein
MPVEFFEKVFPLGLQPRAIFSLTARSNDFLTVSRLLLLRGACRLVGQGSTSPGQ